MLPELLAKNDLTLPVGTECDRCNDYAGRKLEPNIGRYPQVAFATQFLGTAGKTGKSRAEMGGITRTRVDPAHVQLSLRARGRLSVDQDGRSVVKGYVPPDPHFDFLRFRRALHHVGLNFVAALYGADVALHTKYDEVRRYVKNPQPHNASWGYGEYRLKEFRREVGVGPVEYYETELVQIRAFQTVFLVDLLKSGRLEEATSALGGTYVPPNASEPPISEIVIGGTPIAPQA